MGESAAVVLALCCCLFPPFVLQSVGLFTPKWVSNDTCSSIGLVYSCCSGDDNETCANSNGANELDQRVLGLQATAFAIMFVAMFGRCYGNCCKNDGEDTGCLGAIGCCCVVLYPIAGLFSFIGCMLLVPSYKAPQLGYSFYLCLTAGCMVILLTILLYCLTCRSTKSGDVEGGAARRYGAVQAYGGAGGTPQYQHAVIEQRALVRDPETGSVFSFIRRINITSLIRTHGYSDD